MKTLSPVFAILLLSTTTTFARADDATDAAQVAHANAEVHELAEQARDLRHATMIVGLATGAALLPTGIVLAKRSGDEVGITLGTGLMVGGSVALALGALDLRESNIEQLADTFDARRAAGTSNADLLRLSYADWQEAAASSRRRRHILGTLETIMGVASTATGVTMLLANPGIFGMDRNAQYRFGSIMTGAGIPFLGVGLRSLFIRSSEEALWSMTQSSQQAPTLGAFMVHGGAGFSFDARF